MQRLERENEIELDRVRAYKSETEQLRSKTLSAPSGQASRNRTKDIFNILEPSINYVLKNDDVQVALK
ncbi:unnamed protein product [Didymodactylos carnosus]|uniref:Uncharacterized protein n=1 Tax=Didymodactylos carnosus TaxID=1234261 RepID=A0A813VQY4_9BILA|nr:unnamed protein product [Didymodactylos carnosus]CAF1607360.1 unnamed protein product [Didymodactylos carnosus]CAF3628560.1 unnamed protein product [Didymodactylos carnosus]CAF4419299.1 unnamed protein product [Didymodactylos carnosus]